MADPLLSHRHPHEHRHCTPRRQLVSIRQASGDDPEYVVNLDERRPVVVAAIRDVEDGRRDTALRCLQERTLSVAAVEAERRPQQDLGQHQAPSRRQVVGFPQPAVSHRSHHGFGSSSFGYFSTFSAERRPQRPFGLPELSPERPVFGYSQPPASRRARRASGTPCVRPSGERRQDTGDSSHGIPQTAVCRRHRQEFGLPSARPFATYSGTQFSSEYPPASSNIRPDGYY